MGSLVCLRRSSLHPGKNQGQDDQEDQLDWVERQIQDLLVSDE